MVSNFIITLLGALIAGVILNEIIPAITRERSNGYKVKESSIILIIFFSITLIVFFIIKSNTTKKPHIEITPKDSPEYQQEPAVTPVPEPEPEPAVTPTPTPQKTNTPKPPKPKTHEPISTAASTPVPDSSNRTTSRFKPFRKDGTEPSQLEPKIILEDDL